MKLSEAQRVSTARLNVLFQQKKQLTKMLEDEHSGVTNGASFDRVEISKELSSIEEEYQQIKDLSDHLSALDCQIQNAEISRQQSEEVADAFEELMKILEVFRRISKGDRVPAADEKKLMEYSSELYMTAKNMALMVQNSEREKHKSLWEDEKAEEEPVDPAELAANTEVGDPFVSVAASVGTHDTASDIT